MDYNIAEAKIHTTQHGYALDSFLVLSVGENKTIYRDVMSFIEHELALRLSGSETPSAPRGGRISRQLRHFPIAPEVSIQPGGKGQLVLSITAGDRPGLLARIAQVLARRRINLHSAKINTLGARAEDTFWISGETLEQPQSIAALREEMLKQLDA